MDNQKEVDHSKEAAVAASAPSQHDDKAPQQQQQQQQQQQAKTTSSSKQIRVRPCKIEEAELCKLLQDEAMKLPDLDLAVSGMAGRFPKSDSVNEFEENLRLGRDMINDQDESRFECGIWGLPPRAGRLKELKYFDYDFFGYTPEEASLVDYQLRLLYEVVYESILDAGLNPSALRGTNTGVFLGLHCNEFENCMADESGSTKNGYYIQFAVKIAQYFDLRGMTATFDAACASGFVGLHNAVDAIKGGLMDQAIVCSVNIPIHPIGSFIFYQMQMLSPTGYSRFMDSEADGYVKSEACVSMLIQRKHLARRNYCSFMSTMSSVDGYKKEGITFPSDVRQEALVRASKNEAKISTNHVQYLEAHGTGTPAGDPQEVHAIASVYYSDKNDDLPEPKMVARVTYAEGENELGQRVKNENFLLINDNRTIEGDYDKRVIGPLLVGSVKTNMGHSEGASGLCALVKVALMLEHEVIYKSLHYQSPNTNIESLMDGRVKITDEQMPLKAKIIPLSCYGFGGANVHVIVRASETEALNPDQLPEDCMSNDRRLICMFGRGYDEVNEFFDRIQDTSDPNTKLCLTDDFLSLVDGVNVDPIDRLMNYRGYIIVNQKTRKELHRSIERCDLKPICNYKEAMKYTGDLGKQNHLQSSSQRNCHLFLPGLTMLKLTPSVLDDLEGFDKFWSTIEKMHDLLVAFHDDVDLLSLFNNLHTQTNLTVCQQFCVIAAFEVAMVNIIKDKLKLARLDLVIGQSIGEIACAYATGLFDERDAIITAYRLGQACDEMGDAIAGKMIRVIGLDEESLEKSISSYETIRIASKEGPCSIVLSGRSEEIEHFCALELDNITMKNNSQQPVLMQQVNDKIALHNEVLFNQPGVRVKLTEVLERVFLPDGDLSRDLKRWNSSFKQGHEIEQASVEYFLELLCNRSDVIHNLSHANKTESMILDLGPGSPIGQIEDYLSDEDREMVRLFYVKLLDTTLDYQGRSDILLNGIGYLYQCGANFDLSNFYQIHYNNKGIMRPVRRRTPSLASLFRWRHDTELFVPRYPDKFSKSSAKCELPIDPLSERDKYLIDHCVEGRVLFPATGYLFVVWRVFSFTKRKIYDACFHDVGRQLLPVEFRDVRLMNAVVMSKTSTSQVYVHYEESTGYFEVKEGGSVVVDGYAFMPQENPRGLLYDEVRKKIESKNLQCKLEKDDIYKQFRVNGYDYGPNFQCIEQCSMDGQYCRVKFNGHFVSLTDSILQSIFLAVGDYCPTGGGLFLPTRFDYVRLQPEIILAKIQACNMVLDKSDGSLSTETKRALMKKIVKEAKENEAGASGDQQSGDEEDEEESEEEDSGVEEDKAPEELPCFFDTYCDPDTGVIITDGIELRGVRATPAPRRVDQVNELLLESHQFVPDYEHPVVDRNLTNLIQDQETYLRVCDTLALELLIKLCRLKSVKPLNGLCDPAMMLSERQIQLYKKRNMTCLYECKKEGKEEEAKPIERNETIKNNDDKDNEVKDSKQVAEEKKDEYDIKKNGSQTLLSTYDQLLCILDEKFGDSFGKSKVKSQVFLEQATKIIRERIQENRTHLMNDKLQANFITERYIRPLIEVAVENICKKKSKINLVEINMDDGLIKSQLEDAMELVDPKIGIDYSLVHPDPNRLHGSQIDQQTKTFPLKQQDGAGLQALFQENHNLRKLDFIVYKDVSCYSLPKQMVEENGLTPMITTLSNALKTGGYCLVMMRQSLTLAERVLLALSEPELVGLSSKDVSELQNNSVKTNNSSEIVEDTTTEAVRKIEQINDILRARCKQFLLEAEKINFACMGQKSDQNGCLLLLFRRLEEEVEEQRTMKDLEKEKPWVPEQTMIRVGHDLDDGDLSWMDKLKENFKTEDNASMTDEEKKMALRKKKIVWLCAVKTKQSPLNGLVGMMQALRRELGSEYLRCYYDEWTFRNADEPISLQQIEQSEMFQLAMERDQLWFCVSCDERGQCKIGNYRHITINDYLNAEECLCGKQLVKEEDEVNMEQVAKTPLMDAFVNVVTRGDLSTFAWHEAPFKYLAESERNDLVTVAYSALNFRDVMLATGRLPLDALPRSTALSDCLLGLEFSGVTKDGRRVAGMVPARSIATRILCPKDGAICLDLPDWMSLEEGASIPVVYATAIMAIVSRGRARAGESILIHAGSGGVGQAALHLAVWLKLEVFVTVGTKEKRQFLLDNFKEILHEDNVFNSRDDSFEFHIMQATKGRGVDMVLNSLAEEKLQASVRCLAIGGRFLEIGKYDLAMNNKLELLQLDGNKTFHGILLDKMFESDESSKKFDKQMENIKKQLREGIEQGHIKPIKRFIFKRDKVEQAFRFMATGKHTGKVLIEMNPNLDRDVDTSARPIANSTTQPIMETTTRPSVFTGGPNKCLPRFQLDPKKAYIITGGLGGFGLELCKWLVGQANCRYLVLTSRTGPKTGYQKLTLRRLQAAGCQVRLVLTKRPDNLEETMKQMELEKANELEVADPAVSVLEARRLCEVARRLAPSGQLGGLFHLAMVLKDSLLEKMTHDDFRQVCEPKLLAGLHLDQAIRQLEQEPNCDRLDYFVAFSSITSGKGNAGQANYAYANSCLERICERRRRDQLHGLAIQWGAIGDVGAAFEMLGGNEAVVGGTLPQRIPSCMSTLSKFLVNPFAVCSSLLPVSRRGAGGRGAVGTDLVGAILHVLGIKDPSKVSDEATLADLGLDSLMAVEIRQYIEREYDMTLNIQEIRSLTIARIKQINETQPKSGGGGGAAGKVQTTAVPNNKLSQVDKTDLLGDVANEQQVRFKPKKDGAKNGNRPLGANELAIQAVSGKLLRINKSLASSYVPLLELPEADFVRLNMKNGVKSALLSLQNSSETGEISALAKANLMKPIFFIPPIHGQFDRLETVCSTVKRPCIGLHWTHKLGRQTSVSETVEVYLDLLEQANWQEEFCLSCSSDKQQNGHQTRDQRVVDLVGYSFGATIAFEVMLALQANKRPSLKAGNLILLDGSPRQIEIGSRYLSSLINKNKHAPIQIEEQVNELLMTYIIANVNKHGSAAKSSMSNSYLASLSRVNEELKKINKLKEKIEFASAKLVEILLGPLESESKRDKKKKQKEQKKKQEEAAVNEKDKVQVGNEAEKKKDGEDNDKEKEEEETRESKAKREAFEEEKRKREEKRVQIAKAMEAFCRKYQLVVSYKAASEPKLSVDCTLIRAEKAWISEQQEASVEEAKNKKSPMEEGNDSDNDLGLSSLVKGRFELHVMRGDHDTFLNANHRSIGEIIMKNCS